MINNEVAIKALELCKNSRTVIPTNEILEYIIAVLKKQIPKKPVHIGGDGIRYTDLYRCPNCGQGFTGTGIADYCYHCGQKLDWSE